MPYHAMSDHIVAIVQARTGSTRFPRKVLADLGGRPLILHVLERAAAIPGVQTTIAAIPYGDTELGDVIQAAGYGVFEGPGDDVLRRYALAAEVVAADVIVRVTGDTPVLCPVVGHFVLEDFFENQPCGFASNDVSMSGYPDGWDIEVFWRKTLARADAVAINPFDREHVTPYMKRHARCITTMAQSKWTGPKLSVDTIEDLETVARYLGEGCDV